MVKVLHLVKYFHPYKGGVESVVGDIVENFSSVNDDIRFTVYANSHFSAFSSSIVRHSNYEVYIKGNLFFFKNQPLRIWYRELKELIETHDIIHLHHPYPNVELSLLRFLYTLRGKKFIITWHASVDSTRWKFVSSMYYFLTKRILKSAHHIVITSPATLHSTSVLKNYNEKIVVIPLSFPKKFTFDIQEKTFPRKPYSLLFVGNLRAYKGVSVLLKAIIDLDVVLSIVGDGPEFRALSDLVRVNGITDKVRFKRNLSDDELKDEYLKADLFVLPSISEAEAFGVVQLEALAAGLPVINTNLNSGVPHVSIHGLTGFTVSPNNIAEMSNAIMKIFELEERYLAFSFNAYTRSKMFSTEKMLQEYSKIYNLN